jgi:AAA domain
MVTRAHRFRKGHPCPICGGHDEAHRGQGERCYGYLSDDGTFAHCTRPEHAGQLRQHADSGTYAHKLTGDCRCGTRHDPTPPGNSSNGKGRQGRLAAAYDYRDEQGHLLYQVVRYVQPNGEKTFRQRRPDGGDDWIWSITGVRRVLYRLPEVLEAIAAEKVICIAEGEADVNELRRHGYTATCNSGGAEKWGDGHSEALAGAADVVIFGDHDAAGRAHVALVNRSLRAVGLTPRLAVLEGLPEHGDVRDWLQTHTQEDLDRVVADARPREEAPEVGDEATPAGDWEVFSLADAFRPRPPPVEIVQGLFELPSLSVIYGAPGTLKSLLLLDLLLCIAAGQPWLAPLTAGDGAARAVIPASTLWVDFDNGRRLTHDRVAAVARAYGLTPEIPFHYVSMPSPWLDGSTLLGLTPLRAAIERYDAKAVVIDNLLMIKGAVDENSAAMGLVMGHLRQVVEVYQSLLIPIHHQRKAAGIVERPGDRLRGHSAIEASLDLALVVEREEGSDAITLRSTKTRDATVPPFGAMFTYEHVVGTRRLHTARFYGMPVTDESSDRAIEQTLREVLKAEGDSQKNALIYRVHELVKAAGINRIRRVIDRMIRQGYLHRVPGVGREERIGLPGRQR